MNINDFERVATEVKNTRSRWEKHQAGEIKKFDEAKNSFRGLEDIAGRKRRSFLHTRSVLEEVQRQKRTGQHVDWELVRQISTSLSSEAVQRAIEFAKSDEEERRRASTEEKETMRPRLSGSFGSKRQGSFLRLMGLGKKQCDERQ